MVKLELYIREITRFLRTVTLKNKYFADQMRVNWVNPKYQDKLSLLDHPYYAHLAGRYILSENGFETVREQLGIPTKNRCAEIARIIERPHAYLDSDYAKAISDFDYCKNLLGYPYLSHTSLDEKIVDYMNYKYGLVKMIFVDGELISTDRVYTRFDEVPIVYSFDTKKKIPFTAKYINSIEQRKTRATYKIPSMYYDKLIQEYHNECDIIKNVLYPIKCSITEAFNADNYDILGYDLSLLEEGERTSLYMAMVDKLNVIKRRWDVSAFTYEELYALSMQAKVWSVLMLELFKQRIMNIRTSEVHSYHLWNYLISKGVGDYSDVLSHKQALFLYKNYPWIHRHLGSDHNLLLLTHKLLYEHNLTVHDKVVLQETDTLKNDGREE